MTFGTLGLELARKLYDTFLQIAIALLELARDRAERAKRLL